MMYTSQFEKIAPYDWFCAPCQIIVAVKYFFVNFILSNQRTYSQTKIDSDTFNISHIITVYSL